MECSQCWQVFSLPTCHSNVSCREWRFTTTLTLPLWSCKLCNLYSGQNIPFLVRSGVELGGRQCLIMRPDGSVWVTPTRSSQSGHSLVRPEQSLPVSPAWRVYGVQKETTFDSPPATRLRVTRGVEPWRKCQPLHKISLSALKEDRTQVDNLLVNFDAGIIWKIFTLFYWNILSWILWNLDKKCSEPFCTEPNFYLTSKIDFDKNVKVKLIFAVVKIISIIDGS